MRTSLKTSALRREEPPEPITFEREDWVLFRTVEGLQQRGGVSKELLRRLVIKEVTDNALDAAPRPAAEGPGRALDSTSERGRRPLPGRGQRPGHRPS